jgi:hypothetical protein
MSALGVALWSGRRSSRGGDRLNGRKSEGPGVQFLPRSILFGNHRDSHWTYRGTIYSVASGPRRSDVWLADRYVEVNASSDGNFPDADFLGDWWSEGDFPQLPVNTAHGFASLSVGSPVAGENLFVPLLAI